MRKLSFTLLLSFSLLLVMAQAPAVMSVSPTANSLNSSVYPTISVNFNVPLNPIFVNSDNIMVFGRWSGPADGTIELTNSGTSIEFTPEEDFFAGEMVMVSLVRNIQGENGLEMDHTYAFQFWIKPNPGGTLLNEVKQIPMRLPGEGWIQCYGAYAGDIDNNGTSDLTVVNEFAEDVRVILHNGSGTENCYDDGFTVYDLPGSTKPSTNEGSDFNHDGNIDIAIGSTQGNEVSVLMGDGVGGYGPETVYEASQGVRGVGIIDMNGDGYDDIVAASREGNELSFFMNDQSGLFSDFGSMEADSDKETGVVTADANNDGIMDLFVAGYTGSEITILLGDGDGGFVISDQKEVYLNPWMIACGDINGDGNVDVASANAGSDRISVLFGNGTGYLSDPVYYATGGFPLAIDLGDIDGDGDLDMVSSNFFGVDFTFWENSGDGTFINPITYEAYGAGSCMLFHDWDHDNILDMTGIDEIDDLVILYHNPTLVGLEDTEHADFGLYPNPANTVLFVDFESFNTSQYGVYDISGRRVLSGQLSTGSKNHQIPIAELSPGVYSLSIFSEYEMKSQKFIVE